MTFAVPGDQIAAQLGTVQSAIMPDPVRIAATTTIAPTTFTSFIVGSTTINTITPPIGGNHMLCLIWAQSTTSAITTAGNINAASTVLTGLVPQFFVWDPVSAKWYFKV